MNIEGILDGLVSHAAELGWYSRVNMHEPKGKNPAGDGLTAAIWLQALAPIRSSGLASTSGRLEFWVRTYTSMLAEPQDQIDPRVLGAVDALMGAYSGDFTLGGLIRCVDLLGAHGTPLSAKAGYLEQGGRLFRVVDVVVPLVIDDLWAQEA